MFHSDILEYTQELENEIERAEVDEVNEVDDEDYQDWLDNFVFEPYDAEEF